MTEAKINRKLAITILFTIAQRLAKRYELTLITQKDSTNGLWDTKGFMGQAQTMTEYLTEKYGKLEETHFTKVPYEDYDPRTDFKVSFEYRFENPKISIGTQWGADGFACLELAENENGNYEMCELMCFQETGVKYAKMLLREWHNTVKEFTE